MSGREFAEWMDANGVEVEQAAEMFGSSNQTIYKWRSTRGVPDKKDQWVRQTMARYESDRALQLPERLTLEASPDQFDKWNRAALREGKIIRDWAMDALEDAAQEESTPKLYRGAMQISPALVREGDPEESN